jgi:hypothetical protein
MILNSVIYAYILIILDCKGNVTVTRIVGDGQQPSRCHWGSDWGSRDESIAASYLVKKIQSKPVEDVEYVEYVFTYTGLWSWPVSKVAEVLVDRKRYHPGYDHKPFILSLSSD